MRQIVPYIIAGKPADPPDIGDLVKEWCFPATVGIMGDDGYDATGIRSVPSSETKYSREDKT
ncbi:MAG: hypothetical protein ACR2OW_13150 [Methyloligellaceae bacterium]